MLSEIRESQERIFSVMKDRLSMSEERHKREEQRHREICTLLLASTTNMSSGSQPRNTFSVASHVLPSTLQKTEYFYSSVSLTSGTHVVSCVIMHLDLMVIHHPHFRKIQNTYKTSWI